MDFNPRARVGRDVAAAITARLPADFNPRARVGRDVADTPCAFSVDISIHAPAWGATAVVRCKDRYGAISIHAPAWGATYGSARDAASF